MKDLMLTFADVHLEEDVLAAERGNVSSIIPAILAGDHALFLALLPTEGEVYRQGFQLEGNRYSRGPLVRFDDLIRALRRRWYGDGLGADLELIEDDFQRMHFEIYMQSLERIGLMKGLIFDLNDLDAEKEDLILKLLPKSGPARAQIIAGLASKVQVGFKLAKVLVEQASAEGFQVPETPRNPQSSEVTEFLNTLVYGCICAMHGDDWSVLDRQLKSGGGEAVVKNLSGFACIQGLYQVAGDARASEEVLKNLSKFGVKESDSEFRAWVEVIKMVAGADTSAWKKEWENLDADQKKLARAEMKDRLAGVLGELKYASLSLGGESKNSRIRRSKSLPIWRKTWTHERAERVLAAVMNDGSGLFSATGMTREERARLLLTTFGWKQMKECIEARFEGEVKLDLLTDLAIKVWAWNASRDEFISFLEKLAPQIEQGSSDASKVWYKVANYRISEEDLEGAMIAKKKIDPSHLEAHELSRLDRDLGRLKKKTK